MNAIFDIGTITAPAKAIVAGQERLLLTLDDLRTHFLLSGSTGSGKSRTATKMALDAFHQNVGIAIIDTHGDTVDDIASHVVKEATETGDMSLLDRLDYFQWAPNYCPRIDPLAFALPPKMHPELRQNFLVAARDALVDRAAIHIQGSTQGKDSFEATPRLRRQLRNALFGCVIPSPSVRLPASSGCRWRIRARAISPIGRQQPQKEPERPLPTVEMKARQ